MTAAQQVARGHQEHMEDQKTEGGENSEGTQESEVAPPIEPSGVQLTHQNTALEAEVIHYDNQSISASINPG